MCAAANSSPILCRSAALPDIEADLALLPWFEKESPEAVAGLDSTAAAEISRALATGEFTAKPFELLPVPVGDSRFKPQRIMLIGAGPRASLNATLVRRLASTASIVSRQRRTSRAAFVLRTGADLSADTLLVLAQAAAEGLILGEFNIGSYKTMDPAPPPIPAWTLVLPAASTALEARVARGRLLAECSNLARHLVNEPGNVLTPSEFAVRAASLASEGGVKVEILDEGQIAALGMGLLLGVARGSVEPPRLVVLHHDPPGAAPDGPVLGLVGKGITFDTGGISIKPADGMDRMKDDMAGGAAVICAMRAIAALGAPIRVVGVVAMAENMPGSKAVKPGDILRSAEGKTVEVLNTDAEGRLILGDALWYARKLGATHLVDLATLTGAIIVALGRTTTGIMGTSDEWVQHIRQVGNAAGDSMWQLPLVEEYREQLKSDIADFSNVGGRPAGSITAGLFLKEFSGGLPWAHLDIAGTAWADDARPYLSKGPTGVAVRTLAELAFTADAWPARSSAPTD
jgi:leucyl aminopeptidase